MKTNTKIHPSRRARPPFGRAVLALAAALIALPSAQAQTVEAIGAVSPFPEVNPQDYWNLDSYSPVVVGNSGAGSLTLTDGGGISTRYEVYIGLGTGSQGSVTVSGASPMWGPSVWENRGGLMIGVSGGTGSLTISNGGYVVNPYGDVYGSTIGYSNYHGENGGSEGKVIVTGAGSTWAANEFVTLGYYATGSLIIEGGGNVSTTAGSVGNMGGNGSVTVTGAGSVWTIAGSSYNNLHLGDSNSSLPGPSHAGKGSLTIADGGSVSNANGIIGRYNGDQGSVIVTGAGSTWTNTGDLILGGTSLTDATTATGTLTVEKGGTVAVGGTLKLHAGGTLAVEVSGGNAVTVGGNVSNDGLIRFTAAPSLSAGDYTPISATGSWSGTGSYEAIGGVWNLATRQFTVAAAQAAGAGSQATVDLTQTQRLAVTGSTGQVMIAFNAAAEAAGGGSTITFTATENNVAQIGGGTVLSAWDFHTDLDFSSGSTVQLSFDVGAGWSPDLFTAWHSTDGSSWTVFDAEIVYDGAQASFLVGGFSSYAITASAVPEPAAFGVFAAFGSLAFAAIRRRRRA